MTQNAKSQPLSGLLGGTQKISDVMNGPGDQYVNTAGATFTTEAVKARARELMADEIKAVVDAEREACAAAVDTVWEPARDTAFDEGYEAARRDAAAAIRARKGTTA